MKTLQELMNSAYQKGETDYWMPPLIRTYQGRPVGRINDGDLVVFACRRGEREVQLTRALLTDPRLSSLRFFSLVPYSEETAGAVPLFPRQEVKNTLGDVLAAHGRRQLRLTESEKSAHVTFFLNGRREQPLTGENRTIIPSRRGREKPPEMRSPEIGAELMRVLAEDKQDFIVVNFAAGDVIGHSSDMAAKRRCVQVIDGLLPQIVERAQQRGYAVLLTADHGLLETGRTADGKPNIRHTTARVPLVLVHPGAENAAESLRTDGTLADVAPTILDLLGLVPPTEMEGTSLLRRSLRADRVLLIILDGWGEGPPQPECNPIMAAENFLRLRSAYPKALLEASGEAVGLKRGHSGNSETGHLTIGAGRRIWQDEVRITQELNKGYLSFHQEFNAALAAVANSGGAYHVLFLLTEQSSHGSLEEAFQITRYLVTSQQAPIYLHGILDGRSAPPRAGMVFAKKVERFLDNIGRGELVTVVGRGFALDRDKNLHLTATASEALTIARGQFWQTLEDSY